MKKRHFIYFILILFFVTTFANNAFSELVTEAVPYQHGEIELEGYLAYDNSSMEKRPGIIIVHEWKGLNEYAKSRAEQLALMGYAAFAIDMYGKGVRPESHEEAGKISGIYKSDRNLTRERAKAAFDFLKNLEIVDSSKIAAIGYCFGGMTVLEMARSGLELKGVASFHGPLNTPSPAKAGDIKAKVIVFHGADDSFVKPEEVAQFQTEMREAKADWELIVFGNAVHSFTVPYAGTDKSTGVAYDEKADHRSWTMLLQFLAELFQ